MSQQPQTSTCHVAFRERLETLLGRRGAATRLANTLDLSRAHTSMILNGHSPVPTSWVAIVELLEALPPKDWPQRWRVGDAEPH